MYVANPLTRPFYGPPLVGPARDRYKRGTISVLGDSPDATEEERRRWYGRPPTPLPKPLWRGGGSPF